VDDIDKTTRELEAKGIKFLSTPVTISWQHPFFAGVRFCYSRLGDPLEVANVAAFLASDLASYISGVSLLVDGGLMAQLPVS
jgi:NAD(P)-dependent dehydrogenase (short-subunit alcohol dehydrogenase family)